MSLERKVALMAETPVVEGGQGLSVKRVSVGVNGVGGARRRSKFKSVLKRANSILAFFTVANKLRNPIFKIHI